MTLDVLFEPLRIKSLSVRNRIVMSPMTRSFSPDGMPPLEMAGYYARRAAGGAGLVLTEGTAIERPAAKNEPNVSHFYGRALEGWKPVADAVHAAGGAIAPQLWHTGASVHPRYPEWRPTPVDSPSGLLHDGAPHGGPMSEEAIADTIAAYARSAASAVALGFDAVELHGAHGYLIDQFFWNETNGRTDSWGGETLPERARFAVETIKAVRAAIPSDAALSMRLSQWKIHHYDVKLAETPAELAAWLEPLADAGVDIFHCSQRRFWTPEFENSDLNFAGWAKKITGKATVTVGMVGLGDGDFHHMTSSVDTLPVLVRMMERGDFDLVSVGRAMIANPNWVTLVSEGRFEELADFRREEMVNLV